MAGTATRQLKKVGEFKISQDSAFSIIHPTTMQQTQTSSASQTDFAHIPITTVFKENAFTHAFPLTPTRVFRKEKTVKN